MYPPTPNFQSSCLGLLSRQTYYQLNYSPSFSLNVLKTFIRSSQKETTHLMNGPLNLWWGGEVCTRLEVCALESIADCVMPTW